MIKIKALSVFIALAAAPVVVADELSETGELLDGIAAIVNEGVVLKSQFIEQMETISKRAAEQEREAEHIVDLVWVVRATGGHDIRLGPHHLSDDLRSYRDERSGP